MNIKSSASYRKNHHEAYKTYQREYHRVWRAENKDKVAANSKKYYDAHRDEIKSKRDAEK